MLSAPVGVLFGYFIVCRHLISPGCPSLNELVSVRQWFGTSWHRSLGMLSQAAGGEYITSWAWYGPVLNVIYHTSRMICEQARFLRSTWPQWGTLEVNGPYFDARSTLSIAENSREDGRHGEQHSIKILLPLPSACSNSL